MIMYDRVSEVDKKANDELYGFEIPINSDTPQLGDQNHNIFTENPVFMTHLNSYFTSEINMVLEQLIRPESKTKYETKNYPFETEAECLSVINNYANYALARMNPSNINEINLESLQLLIAESVAVALISELDTNTFIYPNYLKK